MIQLLPTSQAKASHPSWHALSPEDAARELTSGTASGLSAGEAAARLARYGPNQLSAPRKISFWKEFFEELTEPLVLMLLVTGVLYAVWGELSDAITIFVIILVLNTIEVYNELRAKRAINSLRKLAEPVAGVRRGGLYAEVPVEQVVPGDLELLQAGRRVPADARLVEAVGLSVDESALTGESQAAEKDAGLTLPADAPLAERRNLVYAGTLVTRGRGAALVTATGMQSELGQIAGLARSVKEPRTHLQQVMGELSRSLVWAALGFSVLIPLLGFLIAHQPLRQMILTGLSLAFALIPEEAPIIITMVLALGAYRLSRQHAIVKRLTAVEALGSVTVIATDKTGTLTENRMEVAVVDPPALRARILEAGALCNDALASGDDFAGDPLDAAILRACRAEGLDLAQLRQTQPTEQEYSFDALRQRMTVVVRRGQDRAAVIKGAPEAVLALAVDINDGSITRPLDEPARAAALEQAARLSTDGLRVLAVAERVLPETAAELGEIESGLTLLGFIGLADPPRPEVPAAVAACQRAGIRTLMITGDHPATALAIARQVGLDGRQAVVTGRELDALSADELAALVRERSIYARATPEHKYRIVQALQANGERVAVTGDGINDAPALAAADIGVAMGETGTDVAREAGAMVLADDNFSTIVNAVREGRLIFANLQKGVRYYLSCKVALMLITLLPTLLLVPVPFAPIQIILMELFMDLMAAASFTAEPAESDLLAQKPRDPRARFMDGAMVASIVVPALGLFAAVAGIYLYTWYATGSLAAAQTTAFMGWLIGHVLLAFNMRSVNQPLVRLGLGSNRLMLVWSALVLAFIAVATFVPAAGALFKVTALTAQQWLLLAAAVLAGTGWLEIRKLWRARPVPRSAAQPAP
ncbi:MAG: cation-translocating P-type ATPase [Anaerolineae bacterium]